MVCCNVGAGQALALASLVSGRGLRSSRIAVAGSVDLRGRIVDSLDIDGKVKHANSEGLELVVMSAYNRQCIDRRVDGWSEELKAYASESVKGVKHFVDLLELTMDGRWRPW